MAVPAPPDWVILIPAKNEAASVTQVIAEAREISHGAEVVVIDDASGDHTARLAREAGAVVIPLCESLGAWGAIQAGLRYAKRRGYRHAITMDADGQHLADTLPVVAQALAEKPVNVVIGAFPERGSPARRLAWSMFRALSGLSLADLTSGLRAYDQRAIELLASHHATLLDYQDLGVLLLLEREGLRMEEVAIAMRPRLAGQSRIFGSWWTVAGYMMYTLVLCVARSRRPPLLHPWPNRPRLD